MLRSEYFLSFVLVLLIAPTVFCGDKNSIDIQIVNDMMYGSDDYFGENSDLSSADHIIPTSYKPVLISVIMPQQNSSGERTEKSPPIIPSAVNTTQTPVNNEPVTPTPITTEPEPEPDPITPPVVPDDPF